MKEIIEKKHSFSTSFCNMGRYSWKTGKRPEGEKIESGLILSVFPPMLICRFSGTPGSAA